MSFMHVVVSDTSVLNYLARLGRSALLRQQFGHVIVPKAVFSELESRPDLPGADCVRQAVAEGWMEIAAPRNVAMVTLLRDDLGFGESEAIALAIEHAATCVLIDEAEGRQRAATLGIPVVGTVGVLLRAKQDGVIAELAPVLRLLVEHLGFRLHPAIVTKVLVAAGESALPPS
jgi:uncharacterized protein